MDRLIALSFVSSLVLGCNQPAGPGTAAPAAANAAPPAATSILATPTATAEVVATILGQPVRKSDCVSRSHGIGSAEIGIYSLVLQMLMQDFSKSEAVTLSQAEIEAFWSTARAAAQRNNPDSSKPVADPAFDEAAVQAKLQDAQNKLAAADVPLLEKLSLQSRVSGLQRALELKSHPAMVAYEHLLPLRIEAALYKKYGGKVVARQISIQPAGARDLELNREVALKRIKDEHADNSESRTRFQMEAEITGRLEHPGIVPVYGLGTYDNGRPFYAMRFIRGQSLKEEIEKFHGTNAGGPRTANKTEIESSIEIKSRLDIGERAVAFRKLLQRFIDVCEAVHFAHSRGILHRDLKPGNVMIGRYGETLVVDWGLAKVLGREATPEPTETAIVPSSGSGGTPTMMGMAVGTPAYMSPEQAAGRLDTLGPASDVYSLGATLYVLLTGKAPFDQRAIAGGLAGLLSNVQRGEFAKPREVNCYVPKALEAICLKSMSTDAGARYTSARDLAVEIERFLADEPVQALPESVGDRLTRFGRKNRRYIQAGMISLTAILLVSLTANYLINEQKQLAENSAREERKAKIKSDELAQEKAQLADQKTRLAEEKSLLAASEQAARELADRRLRSATAQRLATQSLAARDDNPPRAGLVAIEAIHATRLAGEGVTPQARNALYEAADCLGGTLVGIHQSPIRELDVSPTGRWLVAAALEDVRVWDNERSGLTETGRVLFSGKMYCSASFSPSGRWLVATSPAVPNDVHCWDVESASFPHDPPRRLKCAEGLVGAPRFSSSHADLFLPCKDGVLLHWNLDLPNCVEQQQTLSTVRIWNPGSQLPATLLLPPTEEQWRSATERGLTDFGLEVWREDVDAQQPSLGSFVVPRFSIRNGRQSAVLATPDRQLIVSLTNRAYHIVDRKTGVPRLLNMSDALVNTIRTAAIEPHGRWLAVGTADGVVRLWDLDPQATALPPVFLKSFGEEITALEFSPNGDRLMLGARQGAITIWSTADFHQSFSLRGHSAGVRDFSLSKDARWLFSGSEDGAIRRWDLSSVDPQRSARVATFDSLCIHAVTSPNGRWIARFDYGKSPTNAVRIHDLLDLDRPARVLSYEGTFLQNYRFSPDSRWVAVFDGRNFPNAGTTIHLIDLDSPNPLDTGVKLDAGFGVGSIAFSPNSEWVAATQRTKGKTSGVRIWNLASGEWESKLLNDRGEEKSAAGLYRVNAEFSPDGQKLVIGEKDATLRILDVHATTPSEGVRSESIHKARLLSLRYVPRWSSMLSVSADRSFQLIGWPDVTQRKRAAWIGDLPIFEDPLCVSLDGRWGVLKQVSNRVPLLDFRVGDLSSALKWLDGHSELIECAAFSSDGRWLVTGSLDQTVRLWDLDSSHPEEEQVVLRAGRSVVRSVGITPDNRWITAVTADGAIRRWELDLDHLAAEVRRSAGRTLTREERTIFQLGDSVVTDLERLADSLRTWSDAGQILCERGNRKFLVKTFKDWMLGLHQKVRELTAAKGSFVSPSVDNVLTMAHERLRNAEAILQIVEADGSILHSTPALELQRCLPFRIQHLASTSIEDQEIDMALQHLRSLANDDGKQLVDCATWAATAARRVASNPSRAPEAATEAREHFREISIQLLAAAAKQGTRVEAATLQLPSGSARDLDILLGHPALKDVVRDAP